MVLHHGARDIMVRFSFLLSILCTVYGEANQMTLWHQKRNDVFMIEKAIE